MKRAKWFSLFLIIGFVVTMLYGCAKKGDVDYDNGNGYNNYSKSESSAAETELAAEPQTAAAGNADTTATTSEESIKNTSSTTAKKAVNSQEKIIRRASLDVETQDFDKLIQTIDTEINLLGGYVESSNISGRYYYSDNLRYGNIVARIPKDKLEQFIGNVYDISNVVNKQESTENVTLQYVDTESHKKSLEIEQERLLALLEKVEKLEDILTLESRLSSVRYELESYERQLRLYDNLVEYSTVTLNIQEVERMTVTEVAKPSVWDRISNGFADTMYDIGEGVKNFFVWFVVNLPYLLIWVFIIVVSVLIGRKCYKKSKAKNMAQQKESALDLLKKESVEKKEV